MWHRAEGCGAISRAAEMRRHWRCVCACLCMQPVGGDVWRCSACGVEHGVKETRPGTGGVERELRVDHDGKAGGSQAV